MSHLIEIQLDSEFRFSPDPSSDVLASFAYRELNRDTNVPSFNPIATFLLDILKPEGPAQTQFVNSLAPLFPAGGAVNDSLVTDVLSEGSDESHINAYLYGTAQLAENLRLTTGLAVNAIDRDSDDSNTQQNVALDRSRTYVSPKIGAIWEPFASTRLRVAWFRAVPRPFASGQTVEPTHIAGFNQIFDDVGGTRFERYGVSVDQKLPFDLAAGLEFTWRDVEIPRFVFGD